MQIPPPHQNLPASQARHLPPPFPPLSSPPPTVSLKDFGQTLLTQLDVDRASPTQRCPPSEQEAAQSGNSPKATIHCSQTAGSSGYIPLVEDHLISSQLRNTVPFVRSTPLADKIKKTTSPIIAPQAESLPAEALKDKAQEKITQEIPSPANTRRKTNAEEFKEKLSDAIRQTEMYPINIKIVKKNKKTKDSFIDNNNRVTSGRTILRLQNEIHVTPNHDTPSQPLDILDLVRCTSLCPEVLNVPIYFTIKDLTSQETSAHP